MSDYFLTGATFGAYFAGFIFLLFAIIVIIYFLAEMDLFFTIVGEGTTKAIKKFGKFHRCVMSYTDHTFRRDHNSDDFIDEGKFNEEDYWDVMRWKEKEKREKHFSETFSIINIFNNFGGLKWVGIPFIHSVHEFRFNWTSLEQKKGEEGGTEDRLVTTDTDMSHILVQDDVYVSEVKGVETNELVPMNITLLLTIAIINPRKALFRIQHWLETTHNHIRPRIREYVGTKTYVELIKDKNASALEVLEILNEESGILEELRSRYGVDVRNVQIHRIDPSSEASGAVDFVELATKQYAAEREGESIVTLAKARASEIEKVSKAIEEQGEIGKLVVTLEALEKVENLTLLSEGSQTLKTIQLGDLEQGKGDKS